MYGSINGVKLFFDCSGPDLVPTNQGMSERPTILALHGGPGFDHAYLKPGLAPIAEIAQIIYLDHRGQGRSESVSVTSCTIEQMADDAAELCRYLGLNRPVILGHSLGGFVALTLAIRHPDILSGLILCSTTAHVDIKYACDELERRTTSEVRHAAEVIFSGSITEDTLSAYSRLVLPHYTHPSTMSALNDLGLSRLNPEYAGYFFAHLLPQYDLRKHLSGISTPTLILTGDVDWIAPPLWSYELATSIAGAKLHVIPDTGHFAFNERPQVFADLVRSFLP